MTTQPLSVQDELTNAYVKGVTNAADLDVNLEGLVDFGTPVGTDNDAILSTQAVTAETGFDLTMKVVDASVPYGRNVVIAGSTDATAVVTVMGRDHLNQIMSEELTCVAGAATGAKAFKFVDRLEVDGDTTLNLGIGNELGLPYTVAGVDQELVNGVLSASGDVQVADFTYPVGPTTGDVRGTYNPEAVMNGTRAIKAMFTFFNDGEHGLFGVSQV